MIDNSAWMSPEVVMYSGGSLIELILSITSDLIQIKCLQTAKLQKIIAMTDTKSTDFGPPYIDLFGPNASETITLNDNQRVSLLKQTWENVHKHKFPSRYGIFKISIILLIIPT